MYKISSKEKNYNGLTSGIVFNKGVATVESLDTFTKNWFIQKGYIVEEIKSTDSDTVEKTKEDSKTGEETTPKSEENLDNNQETEDLDKDKTKAELLEEAKALGIENIRSKATKDEIEKLIADKKVELEALESNDSDKEDPKTGEENEDLEGGE